MPENQQDRAELTFAMKLSLWVGLLMLVLKAAACWVTGSSAILSDAAESVVHIVAVGFAFYSLQLSYKPADENPPVWALQKSTSSRRDSKGR